MMICKKFISLAMGTFMSCFLLSGCFIISEESCLCKQHQENRNEEVNGISATLGGKLFSSAWIQRSAEYDALCLQAYNSAEDYLHKMIKVKGDKPWAIVTDVDETIVDNTPISVAQALKGEDYTQKSWDKWCEQAKAEALLGAVKFFKEADRLGVQIFYISNRVEANRQGTLKNLHLLGLPQVKDSHLLLRSNTSDKSARRQKVLNKFNIMILLGDALGDFDHLFDTKDEKQRKDTVLKMAKDFGTRFIILPNPNYGAWEKAMNNGYPPLWKKDQILKTKLQND